MWSESELSSANGEPASVAPSVRPGTRLASFTPISDSGSSWQGLLVGTVGTVGWCRSHFPSPPKDHCSDRIFQTELSLAKHSFQIKTRIRAGIIAKIQPNPANPLCLALKSAVYLEILKPCISWCVFDLKELFACLSLLLLSSLFYLLNMNRPIKIPQSYCHLHEHLWKGHMWVEWITQHTPAHWMDLSTGTSAVWVYSYT